MKRRGASGNLDPLATQGAADSDQRVTDADSYADTSAGWFPVRCLAQLLLPVPDDVLQDGGVRGEYHWSVTVPSSDVDVDVRQ